MASSSGSAARAFSARSIDGRIASISVGRCPGRAAQEAEAAGWFRTDGRSLTFFDPSLLEEFELRAACQMIFYDDLASRICAEPSGQEAVRACQRVGFGLAPVSLVFRRLRRYLRAAPRP